MIDIRVMGVSLVAHYANPLEVKFLCQLRKAFG